MADAPSAYPQTPRIKASPTQRKPRRNQPARGAIVIMEWAGEFGDFQFTTCHGEDKDD